MIRRLAPLLLCVACATSPQPRTPAATPANRAIVLAAADQLFAAMRDRDENALRRLLHPRALLYSVRPETGRTSVLTADEFVAAIVRSDLPLHERIFQPRVEEADGIASVWASYDFRRGEEFSHCGTDAMHFVRDNGEWKVVAITYTVLTSGCLVVQ